jgi:hypothetical protein
VANVFFYLSYSTNSNELVLFWALLGRERKWSSPEVILICLSQPERLLNHPLNFTTPWQPVVNYLGLFIDTEQVFWVNSAKNAPQLLSTLETFALVITFEKF